MQKYATHFLLLVRTYVKLKILLFSYFINFLEIVGEMLRESIFLHHVVKFQETVHFRSTRVFNKHLFFFNQFGQIFIEKKILSLSLWTRTSHLKCVVLPHFNIQTRMGCTSSYDRLSSGSSVLTVSIRHKIRLRVQFHLHMNERCHLLRHQCQQFRKSSIKSRSTSHSMHSYSM